MVSKEKFRKFQKLQAFVQIFLHNRTKNFIEIKLVSLFGLHFVRAYLNIIQILSLEPQEGKKNNNNNHGDLFVLPTSTRFELEDVWLILGHA